MKDRSCKRSHKLALLPCEQIFLDLGRSKGLCSQGKALRNRTGNNKRVSIFFIPTLPLADSVAYDIGKTKWWELEPESGRIN